MKMLASFNSVKTAIVLGLVMGAGVAWGGEQKEPEWLARIHAKEKAKAKAEAEEEARRLAQAQADAWKKYLAHVGTYLVGQDCCAQAVKKHPKLEEISDAFREITRIFKRTGNGPDSIEVEYISMSLWLDQYAGQIPNGDEKTKGKKTLVIPILKKAADDAGIPQASLRVGDLYAVGEIGPANIRSASKYWIAAIKQVPSSDINKVREQIDLLDPSMDIFWLEDEELSGIRREILQIPRIAPEKVDEKLIPAAESGDEQAALSLGWAYLRALDLAPAQKFLKIAAEQQNDDAIKSLKNLDNYQKTRLAFDQALSRVMKADNETRATALRHLKENLEKLEAADKTGEVFESAMKTLADNGDKIVALRLSKKYTTENKVDLANKYLQLSQEK